MANSRQPPLRHLVKTLTWETWDGQITVTIQVCTVTNKIHTWYAEDWHGNDATHRIGEDEVRDYVDEQMGEEIV